jgi:dihydrofolate reductase
LNSVNWNNSRLIRGNVAEEVSRLKAQPGKNINIVGSGELVRSLMQNDLIDEYQLMVCPVLLGVGKRLFNEGSDKKSLRLVDTRAFDSGMLLLTYRIEK